MTVQLHESVDIAHASPVAGKAGRFRVQIISAGLGSSGYYPASTIESAVQRKVWPKGTHVYLDHPGVGEATDRPERSLRDLVGVLASDAVWNPTTGAAEAEARIYSPYRPLLEEMADDIGLSIRASGTIEMGEADDFKGPIVTALHEAASVDFVTKAGRGGRVLEVLESLRPTGLIETTADDTMDQLRRAVKDTYEDQDRDRYAWVRDFDPDRQLVYFDTEHACWQQTYTRAGDNQSVALTGERTEVRPVTTFHPVTSAGQIGESAPTITTKESAMTVQIEEARLAELTAAADRVTALEAELATEKQRAEAAEADARQVAREAYNTQVASALAAADLPDAARQRLADQLTLDESATDIPTLATATAAIEAEKQYLAAVAAPQRRLGFGGSPAPAVESYTNPWDRPINTQEA